MKIKQLQAKAAWVRNETLRLHGRAPEVRIASCLSDVEIFVALYYGGLLNCTAENCASPDRDRLIVSKGHGAVSLYPILADLGFFDSRELAEIDSADSLLTAMPDSSIPGIETINGSLGHGLGVACGMALALRANASDAQVFVLCGDGELNCGAVWEAVMFAAHHQLSNLVLIVDNNSISMLGYQAEILGLEPLEKKFRTFGFETASTDGHDIEQLYANLATLKYDSTHAPKALIANTIKGRGVPELEHDSLCHIKSLKPEHIDRILAQ